MRVYRTGGGLRCLVTHTPMDPASDATQALLEELQCDPLYIRLCRKQECFRARLTPKPWRCGAGRPPPGYPWETPEAEQRFRAWQKDYEHASRAGGVCRLLAQLGSRAVHPQATSILALHDRWCCRSDADALL